MRTVEGAGGIVGGGRNKMRTAKPTSGMMIAGIVPYWWMAVSVADLLGRLGRNGLRLHAAEDLGLSLGELDPPPWLCPFVPFSLLATLPGSCGHWQAFITVAVLIRRGSPYLSCHVATWASARMVVRFSDHSQ